MMAKMSAEEVTGCRLVTSKPVSDGLDVSTIGGLRRLVLETAEQWTSGYYGDRNLRVEVDGMDATSIVVVSYDEDGNPLKRVRCTVTVTEMTEDIDGGG
jgi:hypothetical protein